MRLKDYIDFLKFCLDEESSIPKCVYTIKWHSLLKFAKSQAIIGVYFEGIKRLGNITSNKPKEKDVFEWLCLCRGIENRNIKLFKKTSEIYSRFYDDGFDNCILKGQGNAVLYPNPYSRTCGDIDVWLFNNKCKNTCKKRRNIFSYNREIIVKYTHSHFKKAKMRYHHIDFNIYRDCPVELHFMPSLMNNPIINRRLQKWFETEKTTQMTNKITFQNYGSLIEFNAPTNYFNCIYQLSHIQHHYFDEGIGLRQFIDYYYVLKNTFNDNSDNNVDWNKQLNHLGLRKIAGAVMYLMKEILGLDEKFLLVEPDKLRGKILVEEVISGGNFGQKHKFKHYSSCKKYFAKIARNMQVAWLYPNEALWEPWFRTYHFFWRIKHR